MGFSLRRWLARFADRRQKRPRPRKGPTCHPAIEILEDRAVPATITVSSTADTVALDGKVTLREAIQSINAGNNVNADVVAVGAYGTADTINFNIGAGVQTITLTKNLDALTKPVTINGYTEADATPNNAAVGDNAVLQVVLNGNNAVATGLTIQTSNAAVKGLVLNNFTRDAIEIDITGTNNQVQGNFIGTDSTGKVKQANGGEGVYLEGSTSYGARTT